MFYIAVICIVVVLLIYYLSGSKPAKKKQPKSEKSSKSESESPTKTAERLRSLVHVRMKSGAMTYDEFAETVGDLADTTVFVALKQKYNSCLEKGVDPDAVSVKDYEKALAQ